VRLVPEFVVELLSPSDRLPAAKKKMAEWMASGVAVAWLIDADKQTAYLSHRRGITRKSEGTERLVGEGPVEGLVLELNEIWEGLQKKGPPRLSQQAGAA
jgi:Uma2 family endonuclease